MKFTLPLLAIAALAAGAPTSPDTPSARGEVTYYHPGLGACGQTHGDGDKVTAVSAAMFDSKKPCGRRMRVSGGAGSVVVKVVDRCVSCGLNDLDLSPSAFKAAIGGLGIGRDSAKWEWV